MKANTTQIIPSEFYRRSESLAIQDQIAFIDIELEKLIIQSDSIEACILVLDTYNHNDSRTVILNKMLYDIETARDSYMHDKSNLLFKLKMLSD